MPDQRLLLISRDDILSAASNTRGQEIFGTLAQFTRQGFHLLVTAPQPDHWSTTLNGPDDALLGPDSIRKHMADAGGVLDGVYFVPRSLLTQRRNRNQALKDMLDRYASKPERCHMLSSSRKFVQAAEELGIQAVYLGKERSLIAGLAQLSAQTLDTPVLDG